MRVKNHGQPLYRAFRKFHRKSPEVWEVWCNLSDHPAAKGLEKFGSQCVMEQMRWQTEVTEKLEPIIVYDRKGDRREVKLNNNLVAFYARMYHAAFPQHKKLFDCRELSEDEPIAIERNILPGQRGYKE